MKILTVKLFLTLFACLYLQQSLEAQVMAIEGDNDKNIEFKYQAMPDDHAHLTINTVNAIDSIVVGKSMILDENGRLALGIGTDDPCLHDVDPNVYLYIAGGALKIGDAMWDGTSDQRLKKNIAPLEKSADKFNDINFYRYEYKKSGKMRYGIMAQEVIDDFPHSVGTFWEDGTEYYTFNPNNLFFMGMKVIQENSQKIIEQDNHIGTLEAQLAAEKTRNDQLAAEIEAIKAALANADIDIPVTPASELKSRSATPDDLNLKSIAPRLKQNIPNPFQQSTSIPYYLPPNTQQASVVIHDMAGKTVLKQTLPNQEGEGKIEIDLSNSTLKGGIYTYSLYVNNQLIDTKKLSLLTK